MNSRKANKVEHKLKPCPFCGGKASVFEYIPDKAVAIRCDRCGATVYSSAASDSEEMLIAKWNHRQAIRDILNVSADDSKVNLVILICKAAAKLAGFKIAERIVLIDVKKKRTWR